MTTASDSTAEAHYAALRADADAALSRIVPDLADDLAALRAARRAVEEQIEPLRAELIRLYDEIATIEKLAEEQASTDADLVALASIDRGHARLRAEVSALHPYIWEYTRWAPDPDDERFIGLHGSWVYLGAHISLDRGGRDKNALDVAEAESLAAALVTFAARFVPDFPEAGEHPGMVFAEILGGGDYDRPRIWYSRDGQRAVFYDRREHWSEPVASGTLAEVCAAAIEWAQVDRSDSATDY